MSQQIGKLALKRRFYGNRGLHDVLQQGGHGVNRKRVQYLTQKDVKFLNVSFQAYETLQPHELTSPTTSNSIKPNIGIRPLTDTYQVPLYFANLAVEKTAK